jgi:hypothetical protein
MREARRVTVELFFTKAWNAVESDPRGQPAAHAPCPHLALPPPIPPDFPPPLPEQLRQPAVVGEMLAGIFLGPTVLGRVPGFSATLFPPASISIISVISSFGLCLFMLLVGLELSPEKIKKDLRSSIVVSVAGILVPLAASFALTAKFVGEEFSYETS